MSFFCLTVCSFYPWFDLNRLLLFFPSFCSSDCSPVYPSLHPHFFLIQSTLHNVHICNDRNGYQAECAYRLSYWASAVLSLCKPMQYDIWSEIKTRMYDTLISLWVCSELYFYQNPELRRSVSNGSCCFPKCKRVSALNEGYEMENYFFVLSYDFVLFIIKTIGFQPE